jgi:hypothetical protein
MFQDSSCMWMTDRVGDVAFRRLRSRLLESLLFVGIITFILLVLVLLIIIITSQYHVFV